MATPLSETPQLIDPAEATQVLPPDTDRAAWLRVRRTGIGSSDASTLVGLNPYQSRYELWADKTGQLPMIIDGWPSEAAEMGTLLEPVVLDRFATVHDLTVHPAGTWRSVRWPWMLANPDGLCSDGAGIEIKTCSQWSEPEWDDEQTPDHAELQAQWCMAVTGLPMWHVAVLIGGQRNTYRRIHRDNTLVDQLVDISRKFWHDYVLTGTEPDIDGTASVEAYLARRFPTAGDEPALVDGDTADDIRRDRDKTRQAEKDAATDADAVKNRVKRLIGDGDRLETTDGHVVATWRHINRLDTRRLTADKPDLVAAYTREVTHTELDTTALRVEHPEVWAAYRARQLRFTR